jgi:Anti-sigma factor NepR
MARNDEMDALVNDKPARGEGTGRAKRGPASATHKALIARNLKAVYGQVASEPVPQYLLDILKPLDSSEDKQ